MHWISFFATVFPWNCTALSQSESRNFLCILLLFVINVDNWLDVFDHSIIWFFSITFNQAGGCFSLPEVGAILFVPSQAVEEQVTLTYKEVNCEKRGLMPREGELFVSGIFKIEPEGVTFKKSVTVLISHSVHEDDNFRDFHELIVENLNQTGWEELETERISSSEGMDWGV